MTGHRLTGGSNICFTCITVCYCDSKLAVFSGFSCSSILINVDLLFHMSTWGGTNSIFRAISQSTGLGLDIEIGV